MHNPIEVDRNVGENAGSEILAEATRRITAELQPLKLFLFGSRSQGNAKVDSYFDLLALVADSSLPRFKRAMEARRVLMGLYASFDILILTTKEWSQELASGVALVNEIAGNGILLYGRAGT